MEWENHRTTQCYETLNLFLKHTKQMDEAGKLMIINVKNTQLIAGISETILHTNMEIEYMENTWALNLH